MWINYSTTASSCWLNMRNAAGDGGMNSIGFSLVDSERSNPMTWRLEGNEIGSSSTETGGNQSSPTESGDRGSQPTETDGSESPNNDNNNGSDGGFPTDAIVGIAVSVSVLVAATVAVVFWLCRRRRLNKRKAGDVANTPQMETAPASPESKYTGYVPVSEMDSRTTGRAAWQRNEMPTAPEPAEMPEERDRKVTHSDGHSDELPHYGSRSELATS
jgi:hypothetical protein